MLTHTPYNGVPLAMLCELEETLERQSGCKCFGVQRAPWPLAGPIRRNVSVVYMPSTSLAATKQHQLHPLQLQPIATPVYCHHHRGNCSTIYFQFQASLGLFFQSVDIGHVKIVVMACSPSTGSQDWTRRMGWLKYGPSSDDTDRLLGLYTWKKDASSALAQQHISLATCGMAQLRNGEISHRIPQKQLPVHDAPHPSCWENDLNVLLGAHINRCWNWTCDLFI